jgi:predicted TIM-barrel fold metal-dependent hydrolase
MTLGDLRDRQRHVAIIPTFEIEGMLGEAERVLAGGAEVLWIAATTPPARMSPANECLDPFWSLAEEAGVPVTMHLNGEPFLPPEWRDAPALRRQAGGILPQSAYFVSTFSMAAEHFLASMVIGGVFDRHPQLRIGIIECGSSWLGPMCERMEMIWEYFDQTRALSRRPTDYIVDQVRVTPFFFEPVDVYLERHPRLVDAYCYSSDYPHSEGGADAMQRFYKALQPFGDEVVTKFFRSNAELIVPA